MGNFVDEKELNIFCGDEIEITDKIIIKQPTIEELRKFGEKEYFSATHSLCGTPSDFIWQLWDMGVDFTEIDEYDLFLDLIKFMVSSRKKQYEELQLEENREEREKLSEEELSKMLINPLELITNIDFGDFVGYKLENGDRILYDEIHDITFNRVTYIKMVEVVRKIHGFKKNMLKPANSVTKMIMIEDAYEDYQIAKDKKYESPLKPLISTMIVKLKLKPSDIMSMNINMFFDIVSRIGHVQNAEMLLSGAYSGFGSLKKVPKDKLNIFNKL